MRAPDPQTAPPIHRAAAPAALVQPASWRQLGGAAALDWSVIVSCWVGALATPSWSWPIWALALAGRFHALGVLLHELCHMPHRRRTSWPGRLLEIAAGYPIGSTAAAMRYHHLRHHRDSGMPTDPYFKPGVHQRPALFLLMWLRGVFLVPFWLARAPFGALSLLCPALRRPYQRLFLQHRGRTSDRDRREARACAREELGQLAFMSLATLALWRWPQEVLALVIAPQILAGLLSSWRLLHEHDYVRCQDRSAETILATTRDQHTGWLGRLLMAPHHVGCHVVHHLHPGAGFGCLPELRRWYARHHPGRYPGGAPKRAPQPGCPSSDEGLMSPSR